MVILFEFSRILLYPENPVLFFFFFFLTNMNILTVSPCGENIRMRPCCSAFLRISQLLTSGHLLLT